MESISPGANGAGVEDVGRVVPARPPLASICVAADIKPWMQRHTVMHTHDTRLKLQPMERKQARAAPNSQFPGGGSGGGGGGGGCSVHFLMKSASRLVQTSQPVKL